MSHVIEEEEEEAGSQGQEVGRQAKEVRGQAQEVRRQQFTRLVEMIDKVLLSDSCCSYYPISRL